VNATSIGSELAKVSNDEKYLLQDDSHFGDFDYEDYDQSFCYEDFIDVDNESRDNHNIPEILNFVKTNFEKSVLELPFVLDTRVLQEHEIEDLGYMTTTDEIRIVSGEGNYLIRHARPTLKGLNLVVFMVDEDCYVIVEGVAKKTSLPIGRYTLVDGVYWSLDSQDLPLVNTVGDKEIQARVHVWDYVQKIPHLSDDSLGLDILMGVCEVRMTMDQMRLKIAPYGGPSQTFLSHIGSYQFLIVSAQASLPLKKADSIVLSEPAQGILSFPDAQFLRETGLVQTFPAPDRCAEIQIVTVQDVIKIIESTNSRNSGLKMPYMLLIACMGSSFTYRVSHLHHMLRKIGFCCSRGLVLQYKKMRYRHAISLHTRRFDVFIRVQAYLMLTARIARSVRELERMGIGKESVCKELGLIGLRHRRRLERFEARLQRYYSKSRVSGSVYDPPRCYRSSFHRPLLQDALQFHWVPKEMEYQEYLMRTDPPDQLDYVSYLMKYDYDFRCRIDYFLESEKT